MLAYKYIHVLFSFRKSNTCGHSTACIDPLLKPKKSSLSPEQFIFSFLLSLCMTPVRRKEKSKNMANWGPSTTSEWRIMTSWAVIHSNSVDLWHTMQYCMHLYTQQAEMCTRRKAYKTVGTVRNEDLCGEKHEQLLPAGVSLNSCLLKGLPALADHIIMVP